MKTNNHFFAIFSCIILLTACNKDQAEIAEFNKNCSCATEVSADFLMEEQTTSNPNFAKQTNTDTIFYNRGVLFTAIESLKDESGFAEYTWYIGSEVITEKTVSRYFNDALIGQNIPITLVVTKKPNTICLPDDDGYDSITKILHVSEFPKTIGDEVYLGTIEGIYRVKSDHLPDSFDIEIDVALDNIGSTRVNFVNYDGFGSNCFDRAHFNGATYRQIWFKGGTGLTQCDYLEGYVHNRLDGVVEFDLSFRVLVDGGPEMLEYDRIYLGRKI